MLVLGATGSLGRVLIAELTQRGHMVRAATRIQRDTTSPARWVRVDLTTGAGLQRAVQGVDSVIDAANVRSLRRSALDAVLVNGTRRVLGCCHAAGDVHYVGISIVGIDRIPYGYYRAKLRQERVIEIGPAPWSLLRTTQFFDLVDQLFTVASRLPVLALPTAMPIQPIDAADVARRLADVAEHPATGRQPDVGGPQVRRVGELAEEWMRARGRRKRLLPLPLPGRVGKALVAGALCTPDHAIEGRRDFGQWLATTAPGGASTV